ncbi:hypothetical protein NHQ30_007693 [Ciborinia camelliae]|nr:hypothetical protein NHQ30_007693 [Ciborinia camelliae]
MKPTFWQLFLYNIFGVLPRQNQRIFSNNCKWDAQNVETQARSYFSDIDAFRFAHVREMSEKSTLTITSGKKVLDQIKGIQDIIAEIKEDTREGLMNITVLEDAFKGNGNKRRERRIFQFLWPGNVTEQQRKEAKWDDERLGLKRDRLDLDKLLLYFTEASIPVKGGVNIITGFVTGWENLKDMEAMIMIGTSAGGPNWVEYLTSCFSGLPSKCTKQLWNFAFAGSDVSTTYTALHHNYTVSLENQILEWSIYALPVVPMNPSKTLVAIWIGINDIGDTDSYTFPSHNSTDLSSLYTNIITAEFAAIETIYQAGFRNYLFMNLPPLQRTVRPPNPRRSPPIPHSH